MTPDQWNPFDEAARASVHVQYVPMRDGLRGLCNWRHRLIVIKSGMTPAHVRCALTHELLHMRRGPLKWANRRFQAREELAVQRETARLLIPLRQLANALLESEDHGYLAEVLEVDCFTVRTRIDSLNSEERSIVRQILPREEVG